MVYSYYMPSKLIIGEGSLKKLHEQNLPFKKALIVMTSGKSLEKNGYLDILKNELTSSSILYVLFQEVMPNPTHDNVMKGSNIARENNCDCIIGFGGGSAIDCAKAIAIMTTNPGEYWDYIKNGSGLGKPLVNKPLSLIAITSTAGTGTEADPRMVVTKNDEKIGYGNDLTYPYLSIVDPSLTYTIPPHLTAYQGFDVLFHSLEGYVNKHHNDMSDIFAEKAISLLFKYLPIAVKEPNNVEARHFVSFANTLSGINESTSGCTGEHAIEHALSGVNPQLIHGKGLIIISLAYYKTLIKNEVALDRFAKLVELISPKKPAKPQYFLQLLEKLQEDCGVNNLKLRDEGFSENQFEYIAKQTFYTMKGCMDDDPYDWAIDDVINVLKESF